MNIKRIALLACGVFLALLGGLWFLQGAGIIEMRPVLCVANCQPIAGPHPLWTIIGLGTVGLGAALLVTGARAD